jgi:hypothetical protein
VMPDAVTWNRRASQDPEKWGFDPDTVKKAEKRIREIYAEEEKESKKTPKVLNTEESIWD